MLEIRLLGRFEVRRDGEPVAIPSRAAQSLLAYLLLNPNFDHRREKLAGLLAPDTPEEKARAALRHALWLLRKTLVADPATGGEYLVADDLGVRLNSAAGYALDVDTLVASSAPRAGLSDLMAAAMAYGGELLPGFYEEWVLLERSRLAALFEAQMRRLLDGLMAAGRWEEVLTWAERWIAVGETPEAAYRALIVAHAARGDTGRAATAYRRCVDALHDDLGVEPAKATRELFEQIATGQGVPGLPPVGALPGVITPAPEEAVAGEAPFKGLQCFEVGDAALFFGREAMTAHLVERLRTAPLLFVVGASGSGKSSLVRAGLMPALMAGAVRSPVPVAPDSSAWRYHLITPGPHPLQSLAVSLTREQVSLSAAATLADDLARDATSLALYAARLAQHGAAGPGPHLFLAVDQFEEVFTLCRSEAERDAFIANLLAACPPDAGAAAAITLVITLRADFYRHCADYPGLRAGLASHQEYIGAMSAAELRRAIECPAQAGGWAFEDGLVDEMLHDAGSEPGSLPLESHALLETWRRRRGRVMTLGGYAASGGVAGAIARTAESAYSGLTHDQQQMSRSIFLRLTELGEGVQDTRRRAALSELAPDSDSVGLVESVLEVLAQSRLITVSEGTAEVAHEALIREWPRLREWLADDREGLRLHHRLAAAAQTWDVLQRDVGELYRGARLAHALEWAEKHARELNSLERAFLAASYEAAAAEEAERAAQQRRELEAAQRLAAAEAGRADESRRSAAKLRQRAALLAAAFVVVVVLGAAAAILAAREREAARLAEIHRALSTSRELSSAANVSTPLDSELGLLLALASASTAETSGITPPVETEEALHRAIQAPRPRAVIPSEGGTAVSPDLALAATAAADGTVFLWPKSAWRVTGRPKGDPQHVLAAGAGAHALAFSPDHLTLAVSNPSGAIDLWSTETGEKRSTLPGRDIALTRLEFSSDGTRLASLDAGNTVTLWDPVRGIALLTTGAGEGTAWTFAFSPDGVRLVTSHWGGRLFVWDAVSGAHGAAWPPQVFMNVLAMTFCGPDRIVLLSKPNAAAVWHLSSSRWEEDLTDLGPGIDALTCSPDGEQLIAAGETHPISIWDFPARLPKLGPLGAIGVNALSYGRGARVFVAYSRDGSAQIWDAVPGRELDVFQSDSTAFAVALSPDSRSVLAITRGQVAQWGIPSLDSSEGAPDAVRPAWGQPSSGLFPLSALAVSPDGSWFAMGGVDILVWVGAILPQPSDPTITTGRFQALYRLPPDQVAVGKLVFSPNGRLLVAVPDPIFDWGTRVLQVWEFSSDGSVWRSRRDLSDYMLGAFPDSVAFSPDSRQVAVGLKDGSVQLVDVPPKLRRVVTKAHDGDVLDVAYSPDGKQLATAGADGLARIWRVSVEAGGTSAAPAPLFVLRGHAAAVTSLAYASGGARLITGSLDGSIRAWDTQTGRELMTLASGAAGVKALALSPDGRRLAALSDAVRVYALPVDDLIRLAQSRVGRSLTPDERVRFLHEAPSAAATGGAAGD